MMRHAGNGIPMTVRLRAFYPHTLIILVVILSYMLAFQFLLGPAVRSAAQYRRVHASAVNEIIFSAEQNTGESFYYLKNDSIAGTTEENVRSDVLMVMPDAIYGTNSISLFGTLPAGSCAVSANIAERYGLHPGSYARLIGTTQTFCVDRILPAQEGLDEDYMYEGIVVLSFSPALLEHSHRFITFATDGDGYRGLDRLVYTADLAGDSVEVMTGCALAAVMVIIAVICLCEHFLFRKRHADHATLAALGLQKRQLLVRILAENGLKYFFPALLLFGIHSHIYGCYTGAYWIPVLFFLATCALVCIAYSLMITRRLYDVHAK